jgi:hypothetical protein
MFPYRRPLCKAQSIVSANHFPRKSSRPLPTKLTRLSRFRGDKLSRLARPSELIERPASCGIRSLAEGERLAPGLRGLLAYFLIYIKLDWRLFCRDVWRTHFHPPKTIRLLT